MPSVAIPPWPSAPVGFSAHIERVMALENAGKGSETKAQSVERVAHGYLLILPNVLPIMKVLMRI